MLIAPAFFLSQPKPPAIFAECLSAHRRRKAFATSVELNTFLNGQMQRFTYTLAYQAPDRVLLRKLADGQVGLVFWLTRGKFVGYDPLAKEMVVRAAPSTGPVVNRLSNCLGGLEDCLSAQLAPDTLAAFFQPFEQLGGWTTTRTGNVISLIRAGKTERGQTKTRFDFDAKTKYLTEAMLMGPGSKLQWKYRYSPPPTALAFTPPSGTKKVTALTEHARLKADPKANAIIQAAVKAYGGVKKLGFTVTGTDGTSIVYISNGSFRERGHDADWVYQNGVLTLKMFDGRNYRGKCAAYTVPVYLRRAGTDISPILQSVMAEKNPVASWLVPGVVAKYIGMVMIDGVQANAVELHTDFLNINLLIRSDNRMVASVTSKTLDGTGHVLSEIMRQYKYIPVPAGAFRLQVPNPQALSALRK